MCVCPRYNAEAAVGRDSLFGKKKEHQQVWGVGLMFSLGGWAKELKIECFLGGQPLLSPPFYAINLAMKAHHPRMHAHARTHARTHECTLPGQRVLANTVHDAWGHPGVGPNISTR